MPALGKLLIRNGRLIDPASGTDTITDVLIEGGKVAAVGKDLDRAGAEQLDASGLIVAPGFIDIHTHLREPGFEHAETIESGSRCAAAGGFTTICCMPNTSPVNDSAEVTRYIVDKAARCAAISVLPIGAITKGSAGEELSPIEAMKVAGIVAISDDGRPVMNARVMRRAMETARALDLTVIDHCEDLHLSEGGVIHEGAVSERLHLGGIPGASEDVMVARDILLANLTGARYHVAHISSRYSVDMVAYAKARGVAVTCEATPHHFTLTDTDIPPFDSNYKMKPPLRTACDAGAVTQGIIEGTVDAIATDHAPHSPTDKAQAFEKCPFGIIGFETAIGLALDRLVHSGKISIARMVELFTTGPARALNLNRGRLSAGERADVTVLDTERRWTYNVTKSPSKSRNSPFHGREFRGGPVTTIANGVIVWRAAN